MTVKKFAEKKTSIFEFFFFQRCVGLGFDVIILGTSNFRCLVSMGHQSCDLRVYSFCIRSPRSILFLIPVYLLRVQCRNPANIDPHDSNDNIRTLYIRTKENRNRIDQQSNSRNLQVSRTTRLVYSIYAIKHGSIIKSRCFLFQSYVRLSIHNARCDSSIRIDHSYCGIFHINLWLLILHQK